MAAPVRGIKLSTNDPARLGRFYEQALGWKIAWEDLLVLPLGDPRHLGQYGVVNTGYDADVFVSIEPARYCEYFEEGMKAKPGLSFAVMVSDVDATVAAVQAAGGELLAGPVKVSVRGGFQALVADPDGTRLILWKPGEDWARDAWADRLGVPTET